MYKQGKKGPCSETNAWNRKCSVNPAVKNFSSIKKCLFSHRSHSQEAALSLNTIPLSFYSSCWNTCRPFFRAFFFFMFFFLYSSSGQAGLLLSPLGILAAAHRFHLLAERPADVFCPFCYRLSCFLPGPPVAVHFFFFWGRVLHLLSEMKK